MCSFNTEHFLTLGMEDVAQVVESPALPHPVLVFPGADIKDLGQGQPGITVSTGRDYCEGRQGLLLLIQWNQRAQLAQGLIGTWLN